PNLEQIQAQMKKLQAQAEALIGFKSQSALNKIRQLMAEHGLTIADVAAHSGTAKAGAKRGPKPGFKRAAQSAAAARGGKATTQAKGKLPPKYLNPKTGETWSGHARPPEWIKGAKDRTKFLISGAAEDTAAGVSVVRKKKPALKKAVARKTAARTAKPAQAPAKKAMTSAARKTGTKKVASKKTVATKTAVAKRDIAGAPAPVTVQATV
ncbi:H-NS family nucleoid-associated regulatory protein, partial [Paraburkholderia humisilvae]